MGYACWFVRGILAYLARLTWRPQQQNLLRWACLPDRKRPLRVRCGNVLPDHEKLLLRLVLPLTRGSNGVTC